MKSSILFGVLTLLVTGCGAQQFAGVATTQMAIAPGVLQLAPKVDIVLVEDDTGRIADQYAQINSQTQIFLNKLDQQGWNYRFATLPLTSLNGLSPAAYTGTGSPYPISQAVASKQDPNWGNYWVAPYPGATKTGTTPIDELTASIFRTIQPVQGLTPYSGFINMSQITNIKNGAEPGFLTLLQNLNALGNAASLNAAGGNGFFRPDALTAIVLLSTGNDSSYVNMCHGPSGAVIPCEQALQTLSTGGSAPPPVCTSLSSTQVPNPIGAGGAQAAPIGQPYCQSAQLSLNYFYTQLKNLRPGGLKFYAAVEKSIGYNLPCLGGSAKYGSRYISIADSLGKSYNICSDSLSSILSDVASNLTTTALQFEKDYIVLKADADPTTIQLTKYINGDPSQAVTIPMDSSNGWTYVGYQANTAIIDYPIPMDVESGYMIQLNGTAKLHGSDTASVTYKGAKGGSYSQ